MKRYTIYLLALLLVAGGCRSSRQLTSYERAGIGAQIGSFFGWLFGQGVGRAIGDDQGEAIGGAVGYMAGGVAGSTIAYNKAEREKVAKTETAREYDIAPGTMSIPLLNVEACFAGQDDSELDIPLHVGEEDWISFLIANNGNYAALSVQPTVKIERGGKWVELQDVGPIGDIPARGSIVYSVPVVVSEKAPAGKKITVSIGLKEEKGFDMETRKFTLRIME